MLGMSFDETENEYFSYSFKCPINILPLIIVLITTFALAGCDPGEPQGSSDDLQINGYAAALTQNEFNELTPEEQYQVANKLYGTLFRGVSAEEFFDFSSGTSTLRTKSNTFLSDTRYLLKSPLSNAKLLEVNSLIEGFDDQGNPNEADAKYTFDTDSDADENERAMQIPLARIKEYPLSRDLYIQWMAYFLSNTMICANLYVKP